MPLSGLPFIVMTVLYTSRENKLSYSAPVHAEAARFTCANQAFLPPSSCIDVVTYANQAYLPTSPFHGCCLELRQEPAQLGVLAIRRGLCRTFGAPCKVLSISNIAIFRVTKILTLKMVKCLLLSYLQVALCVAELQVCTATRSPCEDQALPLSWAPPSSAEGGKSPQGQPCCRLQWLRLAIYKRCCPCSGIP